MLSTTILTAALAVFSFSTPTTSRAIPFQIIVATPSQPTLLPWYLQCCGNVTSTPSLGANYTFSDTNPLGEISCDGTPIGAGTGALSTIFTGLKGKDSINTRFGIDENNYLTWTSGRFTQAVGGIATFVLDKQTVWAVFGGKRKGVEAKLLAKF